MTEFGYMPEDVSRATVQVLETLEILMNSKVLKTIVGRYDFLKQTLPTLQASTSNPRYSSDVQEGIGRYSAMYNDRKPFENTIEVVRNPNGIHLPSLFCNSVIRGMRTHAVDELQEIGSLKRASAVTRRKVKLLETIRIAGVELEKESASSAAYNSGKQALLDLEAQLA